MPTSDNYLRILSSERDQETWPLSFLMSDFKKWRSGSCAKHSCWRRRDRGRNHNDKPCLVNALRKGGQGLGQVLARTSSEFCWQH